jgi:hypothetical protein
VVQDSRIVKSYPEFIELAPGLKIKSEDIVRAAGVFTNDETNMVSTDGMAKTGAKDQSGDDFIDWFNEITQDEWRFVNENQELVSKLIDAYGDLISDMDTDMDTDWDGSFKDYLDKLLSDNTQESDSAQGRLFDDLSGTGIIDYLISQGVIKKKCK